MNYFAKYGELLAYRGDSWYQLVSRYNVIVGAEISNLDAIATPSVTPFAAIKSLEELSLPRTTIVLNGAVKAACNGIFSSVCSPISNSESQARERIVRNNPDLARLDYIGQLMASYSSLPESRKFSQRLVQILDRSRLTHSIDIERVMTRIVENPLNKGILAPKIAIALQAAALWHDGGHLPFSHVLEPTMHRDHDKIGIDLLKSDRGRANAIKTISELYEKDLALNNLTAEEIYDTMLTILEDENYERVPGYSHVLREIADRVGYVLDEIELSGLSQVEIDRVKEACNDLIENTEITNDGRVILSYAGTKERFLTKYPIGFSAKRERDEDINTDVPSIFLVQDARRLIHVHINQHPNVDCAKGVLRSLFTLAVENISTHNEREVFFNTFATMTDNEAIEYIAQRLPITYRSPLQKSPTERHALDAGYVTACWLSFDGFDSYLMDTFNAAVSGPPRPGAVVGEEYIRQQMLVAFHKIPGAAEHLPPAVVVTTNYGKQQPFLFRDVNGELFTAHTVSQAQDDDRIIALHLPAALPLDIREHYIKWFKALMHPLIPRDKWKLNELLEPAA